MLRARPPYESRARTPTNSLMSPILRVCPRGQSGGSSRPQRADDLAIVRLFPLFWSMHPRLKPTVRCLNKRSFARASGVKNRTRRRASPSVTWAKMVRPTKLVTCVTRSLCGSGGGRDVRGRQNWSRARDHGYGGNVLRRVTPVLDEPRRWEAVLNVIYPRVRVRAVRLSDPSDDAGTAASRPRRHDDLKLSPLPCPRVDARDVSSLQSRSLVIVSEAVADAVDARCTARAWPEFLMAVVRCRKGEEGPQTPCQTIKVSGSGSSYPHHHVLVRPSSRPRRGRRAGCKGCTSRGDSGRVESSP